MSELDPYALAAPFLDSMPKSARMAWPFVEAMAPSPLSANKILEHLAANGIPIGRSTGLALVRAVRGQTVQRDYVNSLTLHALPNPARIEVSLPGMSKTYAYIVQTHGVHSFTGESIIIHTTVSSEVVLTKQAAIDIAEGYIASTPDKYPILIEGSQVVKIKRDASRPIA